jgi:hypothetical protein
VSPELALWVVTGCIGAIVLALAGAVWDAARRPARWLTLPSLDEREYESRHSDHQP